ncbi:hypothetical protein APHAL10511_006997 [Amanita phalloides]|nr:hypothetical protein APHAL10511_006997 [Amanita phalloides]
MGSATSKHLRRVAKPTVYHKLSPISEDSVICNSRSIKRNNDQDNNFLAKIKHLGPVHVDRGIHSPLPSSIGLSPKAYYYPTLVFPVQTLHEVLDKRKTVTSPSDLASLSEHYGMNREELDQLANVVNSPSVQASTGIRFDTGQEVFRRTALWVNPQFRVCESRHNVHNSD